MQNLEFNLIQEYKEKLAQDMNSFLNSLNYLKNNHTTRIIIKEAQDKFKNIEAQKTYLMIKSIDMDIVKQIFKHKKNINQLKNEIRISNQKIQALNFIQTVETEIIQNYLMCDFKSDYRKRKEIIKNYPHFNYLNLPVIGLILCQRLNNNTNELQNKM